MGEWSKKVGEKGEEIVGEFLHLIGWGNAQNNITLDCIKGKNHGTSKSPKTTHGIDYLFSYKSQLLERTLDNAVISVKNTSNSYPSSPNSKFKEHFADLAKTLDCFKRSTIRRNVNNNFYGIDNSRDVGVLFWISLSDSGNKDIISQVASVRNIDSYNYKTIYIVDNKRASFIYNTINYLKNLRPDSDIEFCYQNTGKNNNPTDRLTSGKILPVDFINSGILLIKLTNPDNTKTLVVSVIDEFDKNNCKRLMGLALSIAQGFANDSLILFSNYDPLIHDNQVKEAKSSFIDNRFTGSVIVSSFQDDFRNSAINIQQKLATSSSPQIADISQLERDNSCDGIPYDIDRFLPHGEMLRVLLEQSFISPGDIKDLLRHRGVFSDKNEKKDTIPLLLPTVLTPNEFDFLRENQSTREDNPKVNTQVIEWQSESSLLESIPEKLDVNSILDLEFANYNVIGKPEFIPVDSDPDCIKINIPIERTDKQKSWANEKTTFQASLEFKKIPKTNKVQIVATHTAKETKYVVGKVTNSLIKSFKDNCYVAQDRKLEKILFSSFTNTNRIEFLFSITKNFSSSYLEFTDIVDVKFSLDTNQDLPEDIEWIHKEIEGYKLNGKKLHQTLFLKENIHDIIHLYNIDAEFNFNLKLNDREFTGKCVISIGFPSYEINKDNTNAEIEINVKSLNLDNNFKRYSKLEIKQRLLKEIEKQKIINFEKYKISQNEPKQVLAVP